MNRVLRIVGCVVLGVGSAFASISGPEVQVMDGKVSIEADSVPLSRLLRLLDLGTGMSSTVPAEFANQNVSVRCSGLDIDDAVHKIFEGQPIDYVFIAKRGVVVTGRSQPRQSFSGLPVPSQPAFQNQDNYPFAPDNAVQPPQQAVPQPVQPVVTPFGPLTNPTARPNVPAAPFSAPGASPSAVPEPASGNTLFGSPTPFQQVAPGLNSPKP